jgi:hypothetical protein
VLQNDDDVAIMLQYLSTEKPALIFTPHTADSHPTHRQVLSTILQALQKWMPTPEYAAVSFLSQLRAARLHAPDAADRFDCFAPPTDIRRLSFGDCHVRGPLVAVFASLVQFDWVHSARIFCAKNICHSCTRFSNWYAHSTNALLAFSLLNLSLSLGALLALSARALSLSLGSLSLGVDRTPYDRAAESLSSLRAALVPEQVGVPTPPHLSLFGALFCHFERCRLTFVDHQDLSGFGEAPPKLEPNIELFYRRVMHGVADLEILMGWFDRELPPNIK